MDRSKNQTTTDVISLAVYGAFTYYALHPGQWDEHRALATGWVGRQLHRWSVWQAVQAIRSLPETRDRPSSD